MNIRLLYDIAVVGMAMANSKIKTGIYRVVVELLNEFEQSAEVDVHFSHTTMPEVINYSKSFLKQRGGEKLSTELYYGLPLQIFGRGRRTLGKVYHKLGIDADKLVYNDELFASADIFHTPFKKIPDKVKEYSSLKRVITIYDLIPILFPAYHNLKGELEIIVDSIRDDYAICISEHTRNDLLNYCKDIDPSKVFVSYLAADPQKFYPNKDRLEFSRIKKKYKVPENYFLSLCTLEPRKNLVRLIRSFNRFITQQHIHDLSLVLVGTKGWQFEEIISEIEGSGNLKDKIIVTGRVPDEDLSALYSNAHSFYYLSLYEGFGLPPLEAMQCGIPVITSNVSSLPEVVEGAGIMVSPTDDDEICQAMYSVYTDFRKKEELKEKGLTRAARFSWNKCASEHIEIYKKMLAE